MLMPVSETISHGPSLLPDPPDIPPSFLQYCGQAVMNRLLNVRLNPDIHERAADFGFTFPPGRKRQLRLARIAERKMLFIHVPKNGGTSVSHALYGMQIGHTTIRCFRAAAPDLVDALPSFALVRDPYDRFLSGYRHARAGGGEHSDINPAFNAQYRAFRSIDEVLDHLEAAPSSYAIDHIFRPQHWYLTDRSGAIAVDDLLMIEHLPWIDRYLPYVHMPPVPHLNRGRLATSVLSDEQRERIRAIYADDFAIVALAHRRAAAPLPLDQGLDRLGHRDVAVR